MTWIYEGKEVIDPPETAVAFVYIIFDVTKRKFYLGQKKLITSRKGRPTKGAKRAARIRRESDWRNYYGSNTTLRGEVSNRGTGEFRRHILRFVSTKSEANYFETKWILESNALLRDDFYNDWVSCRINRNVLSKITRDDTPWNELFEKMKGFLT